MGEGETAMHNWKKFAKRVMAGALCAVCLASLLPSGLVAMAAPGDDNSMRIEYIGHKHTDTIGDDPLGIYIMVDRAVQVQMHYDRTDTMPSGDPLTIAKQRGGATETAYDGQFFTTEIRATGGTDIAQITARKNTDTTTIPGSYPTNPALNIHDHMETFSVTGQFNSVTRDGNYKGSIQGQSDKDAELRTRITMSRRSSITLRCIQDETFSNYPMFEITAASGNFEYLQSYIDGTSEKENSFGTYSTDSTDIRTLNGSNKAVAVRIGHPDGTTIQDLEFIVPQVYAYDKMERLDKDGKRVEYVLKAGGDPKNWNDYIPYADAKATKDFQDKQIQDAINNNKDPNEVVPPETRQQLVSVENNLFRKDTTYTLEFVPLTSIPRYLYIATPTYVLNEIRERMEEEQLAQRNYNYFEFESAGDSLEHVAGDTFKIKMTETAFDYDFPITWEWKPEEVEIAGEPEPVKFEKLSKENQTKAKNVISEAYLRRVNGTDENTITFSNTNKDDLRMEGDVKGKLIATVKYPVGTETSDDIKGNENADTPNQRTVEFDITISGKGTKAGIKAHSTWTGTEDGLKKTLLSNQPD